MSMSETDAAPDVPVAGDLLPGDRLSPIGDETTSAPVTAIDPDSGRVVPDGASAARSETSDEPGTVEVVGPAIPHATSRELDPPLVEVTDLDVVHRARRRKSVHAVRGVSLAIAPGEVLGLVGESGSGKSTIAGTLTGLVPVTSGSVRVAGVEVAGASRRAMLPVRRNTGVVYQNPASALNPRRTVGASIAEPLMLHSPSTRRGGAPGCVNSSSRWSCRNRWLIGTHIK